MKGDQIPETHHIARYCRGDAVGTGAAFLLRTGEDYVSVNWLESLNLETRDAEISEIRKVLGKKLTLGSKARIAVLNVGNTRQYVISQTTDNRSLPFLHEPLPEDESHSGIHNTRCEDEMLVAELIAETVLEDYPAR